MATFASNSCYSTQHVENQNTTSARLCQYQKFYNTLAEKGVSPEKIMKFIHTSAGCIPLLFYYISKLQLLSSIIDVTDDAEKVLTIGKFYTVLPVFIAQAVRMLVCYYIAIASYSH